MNPLKIVPPNYRWNTNGTMPDWRRRLPQQRQSIIFLQSIPIIVSHAAGYQLVMIAVQKVSLEPMPQFGVPMNCHHVGKVIRTDINPPSVPVEKPGILCTANDRQKAVPYMGIALNNGHVTARMVARKQTRRSIEQTLIEFAPLNRKPVAKVISETGILIRQASN